ncbi:hypothetical protein SEHO0A_00972 [Salmonella enterica subsp. houtenae str. ATCC BAA-1581]|nr:hypothetical protein SEHO0A_00972 [Salmonella enterica subsp. houtenae str. ATCC BAA-1581]ENZ87480.1 hypothetical protein D088_140001 [Salmonella enterica subsp. houtenae serovar 16:z4,z32:-- str. RKS3027]
MHMHDHFRLWGSFADLAVQFYAVMHDDHTIIGNVKIFCDIQYTL